MEKTTKIIYENNNFINPEIKYHTNSFRIKMFSSCRNSLIAIQLLYKNAVSCYEKSYYFHSDMLAKKRINELQHQ